MAGRSARDRRRRARVARVARRRRHAVPRGAGARAFGLPALVVRRGGDAGARAPGLGARGLRADPQRRGLRVRRARRGVSHRLERRRQLGGSRTRSVSTSRASSSASRRATTNEAARRGAALASPRSTARRDRARRDRSGRARGVAARHRDPMERASEAAPPRVNRGQDRRALDDLHVRARRWPGVGRGCRLGVLQLAQQSRCRPRREVHDRGARPVHRAHARQRIVHRTRCIAAP